MVTSVEIVRVEPCFTAQEQQALVGFLSGYRGLTREAYALDLRQFVSWCAEHALPLFSVRRMDIEWFARDLEAKGKARATVARRLCTVAGLFRYAEEEGLIDHSPAPPAKDPQRSSGAAWTVRPKAGTVDMGRVRARRRPEQRRPDRTLRAAHPACV